MTLLLIIYLASVPFAFLAMLQEHFDGWTDRLTAGDFLLMIAFSLAPVWNTVWAGCFLVDQISRWPAWKKVIWKKRR